MRIGVNLLFLIPGEVGGTEMYARALSATLARAFPVDEQVLFCNRENAGTFPDCPGQTVVRCPVTARFRPGRLFYEQARLPAMVRRHAVDVLWSPGYTSPFRLSRPSVVTIHDLQFRHHPEDFSWPARLATRLLVKASCARADHVLTGSNASAEDIVRLGKVPPDRVTAAPYGVSAGFFDCVPPDRLEELLASAVVRRPFMLTVANSYPHKNLARLVAAFGRLEGEIPHALVIVGCARRGEDLLLESCRRLKDPARVLRREGLQRETLRALYQAADLFLFPTLFEGFGLPVIEAMASGVPVACSDIPPLREVSGDAAELFDPRDDAAMAGAIRRLLADAARRAELSALGLARAESFTWERTARATREAFEKAIGSFRTSGKNGGH